MVNNAAAGRVHLLAGFRVGFHRLAQSVIIQWSFTVPVQFAQNVIEFRQAQAIVKQAAGC